MNSMNLDSNSILVVDDNEDVRVSLAILLEDEGYKVVQASDGQEALVNIREKPFDLMVSDIFMPNMDGVQLFKQARSINPKLGCILISGGGLELDFDGNDNNPLSIGKLQAEAYTVLRKPFSPEKLFSLIRDMLSA